MERVPCFGCILWCPKISQEMDDHAAENQSLHTTKAIGKLLSEAVIKENSNMDWRNPFLLLDIVCGKGYKVKGEKDGSIMIPVMEKTSANNANVPVNQRMWYLTVTPCCLKLGVEMLRRVPTTVMLWDVEKLPYEVVTEKSKFQGEIYLNTFLGPVNALIFHHEEISRERIRSMQGSFATSELELFSDDYRRRLINNMVLPLFAVHLSKQSPLMRKPEIQERLEAAVTKLVGESDEMGSEDEENSEETATDQPKSKGKARQSKSSEPPKAQGTVDNAPDKNPSGQPVKVYTPSATFAVPLPLPSAPTAPLPAIPSTSAGCSPIVKSSADMFPLLFLHLAMLREASERGHASEGMGLEEPGPSSKGSSVTRSTKTQRLTADTSDIEVIQLDSDDDEPPASNDNRDPQIDLEQGNGSGNLKRDEDDEDANA